MRESFREIAQFMDPVEPPNSLSDLLAMHSGGSAISGFAEVWRRHNHPDSREERFVFQNTFLMDAFRGPTPDSKRGRRILGVLTGGLSELARATEALTETLGKAIIDRFVDNPHALPWKIAVEDRAEEFGEQFGGMASIAAMCEVWTNREQDILLRAWDGEIAGKNSKISERMLSSSGLLTVSSRFPVSDGGFHRYRAEDGEDKFAGKGVMLTRIDVGMGDSRLDVYSTHLNAGGGATRLLQVLEMATFVVRTRDDRNPAIIAGDFNVDRFGTESRLIDQLVDTQSDIFRESLELLPTNVSAAVRGFRGTAYELMLTVFSLLGFEDLWERRGMLASGPTRGYTSNMVVSGAADQICPADVEDAIPLCMENNLTAPEAQRIDHVFVSVPARHESFSLDFTRPRRLRLDRPADADRRNELPFMSDHLGITMILLLTPA